jgi:hypothetical protein
MPPRRAAVPTRKFLKPKVLKSSSGRSFQSEQFIQNFWQLTKILADPDCDCDVL